MCKNWRCLNTPENILLLFYLSVTKVTCNTTSLLMYTPLYYSMEVYNRTHYTETLYKVSCQSSHFVFRFFRIATASPASSPSSSSCAPPTMHGMSHGGMFQLHQILENWITEHTAGVLGLTSRKWSASLVEVDCDQRGVAGVAAVLSDLEGKTGILHRGCSK